MGVGGEPSLLDKDSHVIVEGEPRLFRVPQAGPSVAGTITSIP